MDHAVREEEALATSDSDASVGGSPNVAPATGAYVRRLQRKQKKHS